MVDFAAARRIMVDCQVRPSDVTDRAVIDAMLAVPREAFLPAAQQGMAYLDTDVAATTAGGAKRHLIAPAVLARMLQAAGFAASDRVLIVGCAFGYVAAVVSHLAGLVMAIDTDAQQVEQAKATLAGLGYRNVAMAVSQNAQGDAVTTPYDVIVLAGATEIEPVHLYHQLAANGRLVGIFAAQRPHRAKLIVHTHDDYGSRVLFDATAPVLPGFEKPPGFVF